MKLHLTPFIMTLLILAAVLLGLWMLYGYLSVRSIERPGYTIIPNNTNSPALVKAGVELREYAPMIVAETAVQGSQNNALNNGFRNIADYIFGNNTTSSSITMTTPVIQESSSQKIAMTTPVLQTPDADGSYTVSFVMPSKYTLESIPKPNSNTVTLRETTKKTIAVITFSGVWSDKAERYTNTLTTALAADGYTSNATPQFARYNPPWTPPWMRTNEIWIETKKQ